MSSVAATHPTTIHDPSRHHESGLKDTALLQVLWPFLWPHRRAILLTLLLLPFIMLTEMAQPFLLRQAIDRVSVPTTAIPAAAAGTSASGETLSGLLSGVLSGLSFPMLCGLFGLFILVHFTLRYQQMVWAQVAGQRVVRDLRSALYDHLQRLPLSFYQNTPVGKLVTRLTSDVENLSEMLSSGGLAIISDLGLIVAALLGMALMDWRLALWVVLMLPVLLMAMNFFRRRSRQAYNAIRHYVAELNAFLQENLQAMDVVQLYGRETKNTRHFLDLNTKNLSANRDAVFYDSALSAVVEFLTYVMLLLVLAGSAWLIGQQQLSLGVVLAFFQFVQFMMSPIEDATEKVTIIQAGLASIDKIAALLHVQPMDLNNTQSPTQVMHKMLQGKITFQHVSFSYKPQQPVLHDVSFTVLPGQTVALVGPSGSGKTTLIKLLGGFYTPQHGGILLDDQPMTDWPLRYLRQQLVVLHQDDSIFSRTLAENITLNQPYGVDKALDERLHWAVDQVYGNGLLSRLPQGFNEPLMGNGKNLSAGERQLVLFARALYHDPRILVLDEATAAVDPQTEALLQQALKNLMQGRTTLMIAHRLSTVRRVDNIIVLHQGKVLETGNHEQLIAQKGLYHTLYTHSEEALLPEKLIL